MSSYKTLRRALYTSQGVKNLGMAVTAATVNTAGSSGVTFTDPRLLMGDADAPLEDFHGSYFFRGGVAADQQVRAMDDWSISAGTATIKFVGSYTDQSDKDFDILGMYPPDLLALYNEALRLLRVRCRIMLFHGPTDSHMQDTDETSWDTNSSNVTLAKDTDAADNFIGARSLSVTLSGANGYIVPDTALRAHAGKSGWLMGLVRNSTNRNGIVSVVDDSLAEIESVAFPDEQWILFNKRFSLSADQRRVQPKLGGTTSGDIIHVQDLGIVMEDDYTFFLPAWTSEAMNSVIRLEVGEPGVKGEGEDTYLAHNIRWRSLQEGTDFEWNPHDAEANPSSLQIINPEIMGLPVVAIVETSWAAPYGVSALFTSETSETKAPDALVQAMVKRLIAREVNGPAPIRPGELEPRFDVGRFPGLDSIGISELAKAQRRRRDVSPQPAARGWGGIFAR